MRAISKTTVVRLYLFAICAALVASCTRQHLLKENCQAAEDIVGAIRIYDSTDVTGKLPATLNDLVSAGLLKETPRCRCKDGKLRDFIYVSGYDTYVNGYAIIVSPAEMDPQVAVVAYMDGTAKVLTKDEAALALEKSRSYLRTRQQ